MQHVAARENGHYALLAAAGTIVAATAVNVACGDGTGQWEQAATVRGRLRRLVWVRRTRRPSAAAAVLGSFGARKDATALQPSSSLP